MLQLLNDLETLYYYDNLTNIAHRPTDDFTAKLRALHPVFLSVINALTEQREKQIFNGWFAKISFITQAYGLSEDTADELQSLRRLLYKAVGNPRFLANENQWLASLKLLSEFVETFSDTNIPEKIKEIYANLTLPQLHFREKPAQVIPAFYATLTKKGELTNFDANGQKYCEIILQCESEEYGNMYICVRDVIKFKGYTILRRYDIAQHCASLLHINQTLYLTNIAKSTQIDKTDEYESLWESTDDTLLVASPEYLMDASVLSRCVINSLKVPMLYLLGKLRFFNGSEATFKGTILNDMLDEYIETGKDNYRENFEKAFREHLVDAISMNWEDGVFTKMYNEAQGDFSNMIKVVKDFREKRLTTEPTFISGKYGLQGRIDMLVEYPTQLLRKDIVELKSGSFPPAQYKIAKEDHLLQVACYNLLLESTFDTRQGVSAILYANDKETPLRDCGKLNFETQDVMYIRNCAIFLEEKMAKGETNLYDNLINRLKNIKLPPFTETDLIHFATKWQTSEEVDKAYFAEFMGLVARECKTAKVGNFAQGESPQGFAGLWQMSAQEKRNNFSLLAPLELIEIGEYRSKPVLTFKKPTTKDETTSFRNGDIVILYPADDPENLNPLASQLLKGSIREITTTTVRLEIWHKTVAEDYFKHHKFWAIEPNFLESSYNNLYASLSEFLGISRTQKDIWLGKIAPQFDQSFQLLPIKTELSEEQTIILQKALSAQDYFLLQGPPGTGKTSKMLRAMVEHLVTHSAETVVLLAFTNRATDEICQKVKQVYPDFIRLGTQLTEGDEFWENTLKSEPNWKKLQHKVKNCRVFVSTVASFYAHIKIIPNFDTVIVDEASQLLEPSICGILPKYKRYILIGDEKQLPAVVSQPPFRCQAQNESLQACGISDLSISVFERLLNNAQTHQWDECYAMLGTQFRTHKDIAGFISKKFYKILDIGSKKQTEDWHFFDNDFPTKKPKIKEFLASKRVLFVPSPSEDTHKINKYEAKKVYELLEVIRENAKANGNFSPETVGVITPYRAQIAEIYSLFDDEMRKMVTVDTVERYQGSERDIIIISLAVNHPLQMRNLQSLNTKKTVDKKLNVALSRAREQLILLGNEDILRKNGGFYAEFLDYAMKN